MAISKSFAGKSINTPGAFSTKKVDNTSGGAIESNNTLFLVGESTKGAPGDVEGIQEFTNAQLSTLIAKYGSGPIVDAALAAARPSKVPGIGGAGRFLIWKTNSTTQAAVNLNEATNTDTQFVVKDRAQGVGGNDTSITVANGTTGNQKLITIKTLNSTAESLGENAGLTAMSIQYTGNGTAASMVISGATFAAKTLVVTLTGQSDGSANLNISLSTFSLKTLVDFISAQTGYTATLVTNQYAAKAATELDSVAAVSVLVVKNLFRIQNEILEVINTSTRVIATLDPTPRVGLPVNVADGFLTGGAQGASLNSDFSDGLAQSLAEEYNIALACVSRDAATDIADAIDGFTDSSSTYTIAAVLAAVESHMRVRDDVEARKEAQAFGGIRKVAKADVFSQSASLGSELIQLCFQDIRVLDQTSNLTWKQPHVFAAMCAGIRLGTEVGEPLTHKRLNAIGIGHFVNSETGISAGDFNADLDKKEAINQNVTFSEKIGSTFRIVVDNTTYGVDDSFIFNRGSVMEAAQFVAKDIRTVAESVFVGKKLPASGAAKSIKEVIGNRLEELNGPDVNIISSSADAPKGFVPETFIVELTGNTARIAVEIKPVQGLDFIFITFTIGDISQSA